MGKNLKPHIDLNVLMIGNSFSASVMRDLPAIAANTPGCQLHLTNLCIGGCELSRHWANIIASESDASARQYAVTRNDCGVETDGGFGNINEYVRFADWDIVTIQQASHQSFDYATYQPFADNIVAFIRKYAPAAEIMVHQTWAYNAADKRLLPSSEIFGFDQSQMHTLATEAYQKLANRHGFRIIPVGAAVAAARQTGIPDVVGIGADTIHLNRLGEYLQGCVWFATLFEKAPEEIGFAPADIAPEAVATLRHCARLAMARTH